MIKIMADAKTVDNPGITLSDAERDAMLTELLAKMEGLLQEAGVHSGFLARLDARFALVEQTVAEVKPLLAHPWVARLLNKKAPRGAPA